MTHHSTYNAFRRVLEPDILCAVPEHNPVPFFIAAPGWRFSGTIINAAPGQTGFNTRAVREGVRFTGFSILHRLHIAR